MQLRTLVDVLDRNITVAITGKEEGKISKGYNFKLHGWEPGVLTLDRLRTVEELVHTKDYQHIRKQTIVTFSTINVHNFPTLKDENRDLIIRPFHDIILMIVINKNSEQKVKKFRKEGRKSFKPKSNPANKSSTTSE